MRCIVAVSGGIDSVVLLDVLARVKQYELIVAHVDHGIRADSGEDAALVEKLAKKYNVPFMSHNIELGEGASEADAREARYRVLRLIQQEANAATVATAHHQDDIIETMIINLMRGTGWRGLVSLRQHKNTLRPLLHWSKADIVTYAIANNLEWREDSTNDDVTYSRNYIRYAYVQRMDAKTRQRWLDIYATQLGLCEQIDRELQVSESFVRSRYLLIMSGRLVAGELLMQAYGRMERSTIDQLWHFICTGKPGKMYKQGGNIYRLTTRELIVSLSDT